MEKQATNLEREVRSVRWGWVLVAIVWLVLVASAWTRNAEAAERKESSSDEYSFSWLDKDKKIYVLQNRRYTKAGRLLLSASAGVGSSNPYRDVQYVEPRLAVFFSEAWGFEAFYSKSFNSSNAAFRALEAESVQPFARDINSQAGALIHWVPWYAKINVFNKVLYFDWGFEAGISKLDATIRYKFGSDLTTDPVRQDDDDKIALLLGTTQQFFLNHDWSIRLDVLGAIYRGTYKISGDAISPDQVLFSNFQYGIGLGYRL
jgi:outer membrane beta-barrel protein